MPNERLTLEGLRVNFEKLDAKLEESDKDHPLRRRLRRSLSWLERAYFGKLDDDVRYIFLWVAFNAAYADDRDARDGVKEPKRYKKYFEKMTEKDHSRIYNIFRHEIKDSILSLVGNKYVFQGFWDFLDKGWFNEDNWRESRQEEFFECDCRTVRRLLGLSEQFRPMRAASQKDTIRILDILFRRLYVLRNQIMHGSSTSQAWADPKRFDSREGSTSTEDGSLNRNQVEDGVRILGCLMPLFLDVMMDHPELEQEEYWGRLPYPVRSDIRENPRNTRR